MIRHSPLDYIDSIHYTSGEVYNVTDNIDCWTGYQIQLRWRLNEYTCVDTYLEEGISLKSFIIREYGDDVRCVSDVVDARLMCFRPVTPTEYDTFSRMHLVCTHREYSSSIIDAINMMLQQDERECLNSTQDEIDQLLHSEHYRVITTANDDTDSDTDSE